MSDNQSPEPTQQEQALEKFDTVFANTMKGYLPAQAEAAIEKMAQEGTLQAFLDELDKLNGKKRKEALNAAYTAASNDYFKVWSVFKTDLGSNKGYIDSLAKAATDELAQNNKLAEFYAEYEKADKKEREVKLIEKYNAALLQSTRISFVEDFTNNYDPSGEHAANINVIAGQLFDACKDENPSVFDERLQVFSLPLNAVAKEDTQESVTGVIDLYAAESEKEDFDIDAFKVAVLGEFMNYNTQKNNEFYGEMVDKYFEGDKDAAKSIAERFTPQTKINMLTVLKQMEAGIEEGTISETKQKEIVDSFNYTVGRFIEDDRHEAAIAPSLNEYASMLQEAYEGEEDKEKAQQMQAIAAARVGPHFIENVKNSIKAGKKQAAIDEAANAGKKFSEKEFEKSYQEPTYQELEQGAQSLVEQYKAAEKDVRAPYMRQDFENHLEASEAKVGQKFKASFSSKLANGALTFVSAAGAGMLVRGLIMGGVIGVFGTGLATLAIGGFAAGFLAGNVSYNVTRMCRSMIQTKRDYKETNPNQSFIGGFFKDKQVRRNFRENYAQSFDKKARRFSRLFGGTVGALFAAGPDLFDFAKDTSAGQAVLNSGLYQNSIGQLGQIDFGSYIPDWLSFGGTDAADAANNAAAGPDAFAAPVDADLPNFDAQSEIPEVAADALADAAPAEADLPNFDAQSEIPEVAAAATADAPAAPAAADVAEAVADVADTAAAADAAATLTVPTSIDAELKAMIIDAARENGTTSYESSIIARLDGSSIGAQVQAAKDFSLLAGGEMQMQILERLNEQFGNVIYCTDGITDPYLVEAVTQVNTDLGLLQLQDALANGVVDGADNDALKAAIVNLIEGAEGGNHYAQSHMAFAETHYPEAFAAAQAEHSSLASSFTCAAGGDNVASPAAPAATADAPEWMEGCDDVVQPEAEPAPAPVEPAGPEWMENCDEEELAAALAGQAEAAADTTAAPQNFDLQSEIPEVAAAAMADSAAPAENAGDALLNSVRDYLAGVEAETAQAATAATYSDDALRASFAETLGRTAEQAAPAESVEDHVRAGFAQTLRR